MTPAGLSALVVDDEPWARAELRSMLERVPGVAGVTEASGVEEAAAVLARAPPDAVFLDIHLAGESGFDLLPRLPGDLPVVFVTAYDEHAVRAFEVNAVDYLLKPVRADRLERAVARLRGGEAAAPSRESRRAGGGRAALAPEDYVYLELRGRPEFVRVAEIACVRARGNYTEVTTASGRAGLVDKPMKEWEERLPGRRFVRTHRSAIVNLDHVERVERRPDRTGRVHVRGREEPVRMSRRRAARIADRFG